MKQAEFFVPDKISQINKDLILTNQYIKETKRLLFLFLLWSLKLLEVLYPV
jgi:hypothetical protein